MMKRLRRKFVVLLAVVLCTVAAVPVQAQMPRWSYLRMITGNMTTQDSGLATISVTCDATYDVNKIKAKCELQQLDGSWKTIKTWTETEEDHMVRYSKQYAIYKNYSYRLKVTAYMYVDSQLVETVTETFDQGYYQ